MGQARGLFLCCVFVLACLQSIGASAAGRPEAFSHKIASGTWDRVDTGALRELLVQFDDPSIDAEARSDVSMRRLPAEDDAVLSRRAARYEQLKQRVLKDLAPDEAHVLKDYRHIPMLLLRLDGSAPLIRLLQRADVAAVYENVKLFPVLAQSLPLVGQPAVAQAMGRTGAGKTVAVLDTGVDYTRSELGSCTAPGVPSGCRVVAALDTAPDDGVRDDNGHGTRVAATVAGIAPGAGIAAIDVFSDGNGYSSDIIEGIDWAIANRSAYDIVAINMSLGDGVNNASPCTSGSPFRTPIIQAKNAGILTVVASGNEGYTNGISGPACVPEATSVGAVYDANVGGVTWSACSDAATAADMVACFSNSAGFLTFLAPGALITAAGATSGGTSFAAPHAAGALAVLAQAFPGDTAAQRLARLTGSGTAVTDSRNGIAKPRLNLLAAQGAPANDNFSAAVTAGGASAQATGWNLNAGKEAGEPAHAGNGGGKSVWWQWTAPASGMLSVDTHGSGFDTLLGVYAGSAVGTLAALASSDDDGSANGAGGASLAVSGGAVYRIAVDGKNGAGGAIVLNWSLQLNQAIDFPSIADAPAGSSFSLGATASSGLPVSYTSQTPTTCSVTVDQASLIAGGTCSIAADQAGDANYLPAPTVLRSFNVTRLSQTIAFNPIANQTLGAPPFPVGATATSGLPVAIVSLTSPTCTVAGGLATLLAAGTCTLQASQPGDAVHAAATPVTRSFVILNGESSDGDVPLPAWALILLGAGLLGALRRR